MFIKIASAKADNKTTMIQNHISLFNEDNELEEIMDEIIEKYNGNPKDVLSEALYETSHGSINDTLEVFYLDILSNFDSYVEDQDSTWDDVFWMIDIPLWMNNKEAYDYLQEQVLREMCEYIEAEEFLAEQLGNIDYSLDYFIHCNIKGNFILNKHNQIRFDTDTALSITKEAERLSAQEVLNIALRAMKNIRLPKVLNIKGKDVVIRDYVRETYTHQDFLYPPSKHFEHTVYDIKCALDRMGNHDAKKFTKAYGVLLADKVYEKHPDIFL